MGLRAKSLDSLKEMYPGSFAMVMATGIVSVAGRRLGFLDPAAALFWINAGLFVLLWIILAARLALFAKNVRADIGDHWRGAGFFTLPAACAVFGVQWLEFGGSARTGVALWWVALTCWLVISLVFFCSMIVGENQVDIHYAINGAWLTSVVATQGLSILASALAGKNARPHIRLLSVTLVRRSWRDALSHVDCKHLLPPRRTSRACCRFFRAVLGEYGRGNDYVVGFLESIDDCGARPSSSAQAVWVRRLVVRRLVDSYSDHPRHLATWLQETAPTLRSPNLVIGLPIGNVHR